MFRLARKKIIKSMVKKEFKQLFRDRRMFMMLFVTPVLMLLIFGYAVDTDVKGVKMAVLDEDKTQESRAFISGFSSNEYFRYAASLDSQRELARLLDLGKVDVFLHIEKNFSRNIKSGKGTQVQLILDGTDSNRAAVIMAYVNQISGDFSLGYLRDRIKMLVIEREAGGMRMKDSIQLKERILFNPELLSRNFFLPGMLGLIIALVTMMLTSMSIVKEREAGTMEQITVTPIRPIEFIMGKTMPFLIVGFIDICIISMATIFWFNVPFNGSFIFLLFSGLVYILSMLAVGLFISTISRTQQQAMLSTFLFFLPAMLFSGFIFPVYAMPFSIQLITLLNPTMYFITIMRGTFLKGVGMLVLWKEVAALLVLGGILLILSVRRFARRME